MRDNKKKKQKKSTAWGGLSLLFGLVLFVFVVFLVSVLMVALLYAFLERRGLLPAEITEDSLVNSAFLLGISLVCGTLLTLLVGYFSLKPLKKFIDVTKEISGGNFDIQLQIKGPKEFVKLADSFNDMARELSSIETLRSDFVSNISHEFKTPVVSIRGFAKLLQKDSLDETQRKEYLDIIISESERLTTLSSNVLLLSRLDSAEKPALAPIRLDEQLRKAILLLQPQMEKKGLQLEIDLAPVVVSANEELLQHVWINLLNNAIKFSEEGGNIRIDVRRNGSAAKIRIEDEGSGMDAETMRHIFDKFYQSDASRATEGNGLGLSLVKRILDLCGGRIAVWSEPGSGAVFTVFFQVAKDGGDGAAKKKAEAAGSSTELQQT